VSGQCVVVRIRTSESCRVSGSVTIVRHRLVSPWENRERLLPLAAACECSGRQTAARVWQTRSRVRPAATGILTLTSPVTSSAPAGPCAGVGTRRFCPCLTLW